MQAQTIQPTQTVNIASFTSIKVDTLLYQGTTDANGFFSIPHNLVGPDVTPLAAYRFQGFTVMAQHQNGNWHSLEASNSVDNRFWIAPNAIQGRIASPAFANRRVQVVVLAEYIVA